MNIKTYNNSLKREKKPTLKSLIQALNDKNTNVQIKAAKTLGNIKDTRATQPLIQALGYDDFGNGYKKDKDKEFRIKAIKALGKIGDTKAIEPLIQAISHEKNDDIQEEIAEALGKIGEPAIESLIAAIYDEVLGVRRIALSALSKIGEPAIKPLLKELEDLWFYYQDENESLELVWDIIYTFEKMGKTGVKPLIQILKNYCWEARMHAASALADIGDKRAIKPLVQALKDEEANEPIEEVREKAAKALDKLGWKPKNDKEKAHYLIAKNQWNELVKMGEIGIKELIQDLKYWDACVTQQAFFTLIEIGEPAVKTLIKALKEEDRYIEERAFCILEKIREKTIKPFIKALRDEDQQVRTEAASILGAINDEIPFEPLIKALKNEDKETRAEAALTLGHIRDERAIEPLIQPLKDEDKKVQKAAKKALEKIKTKKS